MGCTLVSRVVWLLGWVLAGLSPAHLWAGSLFWNEWSQPGESYGPFKANSRDLQKEVLEKAFLGILEARNTDGLGLCELSGVDRHAT